VIRVEGGGSVYNYPTATYFTVESDTGYLYIMKKHTDHDRALAVFKQWFMVEEKD